MPHTLARDLIYIIPWRLCKEWSWNCFPYPQLSKLRCRTIWLNIIFLTTILIVFICLLKYWHKIFYVYFIHVHHLIVLLLSFFFMFRFCFYSAYFRLHNLFTVILFLCCRFFISQILTFNIWLMLRKFKSR